MTLKNELLNPEFVGPQRPIRVVHNHGAMLLRDWEIDGDYVKGIIIGGGEQSRLFQATLNKSYQVGIPGKFPIYGRFLCKEWGTPFFRVDVCFC